MGTDGGRFDVSNRITADRLNRKTVLVDTGAGIAAAAATPGMIAFCTATGSGFVAGDLYERDETNTFWRRVFEAAAYDVFGGGSNGVLNVAGGTVTLDSDKRYRAVHVESGATLDTAGYTLRTRYLRNEGGDYRFCDGWSGRSWRRCWHCASWWTRWSRGRCLERWRRIWWRGWRRWRRRK